MIVILGAGECPPTESRKRTSYRRNSDVTENFPAFYSLPAQMSTTWPKRLSENGRSGCVFSTVPNMLSSTKPDSSREAARPRSG
jgi:hypothetical protein